MRDIYTYGVEHEHSFVELPEIISWFGVLFPSKCDSCGDFETEYITHNEFKKMRRGLQKKISINEEI